MKERKVRVFISSTFRDMDGERNYLNDYVFPQIREYCEKRYIDFTPIDLRWGITEEDSRSGLVLAACMEEVDNSRPFFIGILGGRYGWTPRIEDINCCRPVITQNQDWLLEKISNSASITEIEMEYAILHKNAIKHASFFIKDDRVELPQEYREVKNSPREKKLLALKAKICNQQKYPVHNYTSFKEMGDILLHELKDMIDLEFPPVENEYGNAIISRHEHSLLQHAETLYSYGDDLKKYFDIWKKNQYRTIHFDGPHGAGTSNLLANLVLYVREHFSAKVLYYDFENADPNKNLMDDFFAFLKMPENTVDTSQWSMLGIDNASILSKDEAQQMRLWLMKKDSNLHVIIAASCGIMSSVLNATPCTTITIANGLSAQRQREFIINYAKKYGKTLTPAQIEKIANGQNCNDVSILKLTLNTIINYGSFEGLSGRIDQVVSNSNDPIFDTHIFDILISELESILQEEGLTEWFKKIITIVALHGTEGISEQNLLSFSQISMEKWAILRPIISQFCHNDTQLSLIRLEFGTSIKNRYDKDWMTQLVRSLIFWWGNRKNFLGSENAVLTIFMRSYGLPFPKDDTTALMYDTAAYFVASPLHAPHIKSSVISVWWEIFSSIPFARSITPVVSKELDELPLSEYQQYYLRLAQIGEGLNRNNDVAWCYEQMIKRAPNKLEKKLLTAHALIAKGQAKKAIKTVSGFLGVISGSTEEKLEKRFIRTEAFMQRGEASKYYTELLHIADLIATLMEDSAFSQERLHHYKEQAYYYYNKMLADFALKGDADSILKVNEHVIGKIVEFEMQDDYIPAIYYRQMAFVLLYFRKAQWADMMSKSMALMSAAHVWCGGSSYQHGRACLLYNYAHFKIYGYLDPNPTVFANKYDQLPYQEKESSAGADKEVIQRLQMDNYKYALIANDLLELNKK